MTLALSIVAILVPVILAMFAAGWRLSSLMASLKVTVDALMESVRELREGLKRLEEIPGILIRLAQLENVVADLSRRTYSGDRHRAVVDNEIQHVKERLRSSPDLSTLIPREDT